MTKNKHPRMSLDEAAHRYANGHYVVPGQPDKVDTSDVSAYIAEFKAAKKKLELPLKARP